MTGNVFVNEEQSKRQLPLSHPSCDLREAEGHGRAHLHSSSCNESKTNVFVDKGLRINLKIKSES